MKGGQENEMDGATDYCDSRRDCLDLQASGKNGGQTIHQSHGRQEQAQKAEDEAVRHILWGISRAVTGIWL